MSITKEFVISEIDRLNAETDKFYNETLPEMLSVKDGLITLSHWFAARRLIAESGIYEKNRTFLDYARANGYDVKIDMQTYKLSYHGIIND
jgi:hypothetical protein